MRLFGNPPSSTVQDRLNRSRGSFLPAIIVSTLFACAPVPPTLPPEAIPGAPADFPSQRYEQGYAEDGRVYRIDGAVSTATFHVFRGGRLARLGHNHVITSRHLRGYVFLADEFRGSRADLYLPLRELVVDDPADRTAAGRDFASELSADAIAGTRANMLGDRGLEADRFPFLEIAAVIVAGSPAELRLQLDITLHGVTRRMSVPARLNIDGERLTVAGSIDIEQSTFGITPFSALGGALLVQDRITVSYSIAARRIP